MELISPPQQPANEDTEEMLGASEEVDDGFLSSPGLSPATPLQPSQTEEIITPIESDLYIAKLSSLCGGSVISFKIKDHLAPDSSFVNLSSTENQDNLLIGFRNIDGEMVQLKDGWIIDKIADSLYINDELTLNYLYPVGDKNIIKTITFFPESFLFDVESSFKQNFTLLVRHLNTHTNFIILVIVSSLLASGAPL